MIEIKFGDLVEATCRYDYTGVSGYFTLVQEIGTIIVGPPLPELTWNFNTIDGWEQSVYVTQGTGKQSIMSFTVQQAGGLNEGDTYDMNFEIGTGSKRNGTWKLLKRVFVNDIIKIAEGAVSGGNFSNLSVTYKKV